MSRITVALASAAALLLTSTVASAAETAAAPAAQTASTGAVDEQETKIICKTMKVIGSRLAQKKQCATKKQWEDRAHRDRKVLEGMQTNTMKSN